MHADAHHLGLIQALRIALGVQRIKGVFQVLKERVGVRVALGQGEAHVVAVQGVGHDQLRHHAAVGFLHLHPKREVVAIVVAVVLKAAKVGHQAPGVGAVAPGVPAQGPLAGQILHDLHGLDQVGPFGGFGEVLVVNPLEAVAGDVVAQGFESGHHFRVFLQGRGNAKHRQRQAPFFKLAQNPPYPCA